MISGFLGLLSTLASLNQFANICMKELKPRVDFIHIHKEFGVAFICLVVATILKLVDVAAHIVVPVPKEGYWTPDSHGSSGRHNMQKVSDSSANVEANHQQMEIVVPLIMQLSKEILVCK